MVIPLSTISGKIMTKSSTLDKCTLDKMDIKTVVGLVKEHGLAIIPQYRKKECDEIRYKCLKETNKSAISYGLGAATRYYGVPDFANELFGKEVNKICDAWFTEKYRILELFLCHEFKSDGHERNADLHFDRIHTLKFFYYLSDVKNGCGPLTVVPDSHKITASIRQKQESLPYNKRKNAVKDIDELKKFKKATVPIKGRSGTLIVFDTDVLHKGGKVSEGSERLVARLHCRAKRLIT